MYNYDVYENNEKIYTEKQIKNKEVISFLCSFMNGNKDKRHYYYVDDMKSSDYSIDDITQIVIRDYFDKSIKYVFNIDKKPTR